MITVFTPKMKMADHKSKGRINISVLSTIAWLIMIAVQIMLIIRFSGDQYSDYREYLTTAQRVLESGKTYYPCKDDLNSWYIHAPGFINYLIFVLAISNSLFPVYVLNAIYIHILMYSCKSIVFFVSKSKELADWFVFVFCIYSTIGMNGGVVQVNTELIFGALVFASLAFIVKPCIIWALIGGVLLGLSNWIRPTVFIITPIVIWLILKADKRKARIAVVGFSFAVTIVTIGLISIDYCGDFVCQSTITGTNLLIGNNPKADGNNTYVVFEQGGIGCVDDIDTSQWTYDTYQRYWKELAIDWILENPMGFIKLIPHKFLYQWKVDTYWCSAYSNNRIMTDAGIRDLIKNTDINSISAVLIVTLIHETVYMVILGLFCMIMILDIKRKRINCMAGLYASIAMGIGLNIIMAGYGRFHFLYMPIIIMIVVNGSWNEFKQRITEIE